jgi:hypothetical protein
VWRELAAHAMTTNWVLGKQNESFPLMYHWRVLAGPPPRTPTSEERADLARMVAYWDGSSAVRERLEAIARSSASVVLFCEYTPHDGCYTVTQLVNLLVTALTGAVDPVDRNEFIHRCAEGDELANVPASVAAAIKRYAPVAVVMNEFYWKLHVESRTTPYPAEEIQRVCARTGMAGSG